jgi:hypothetical protein
VSLGSGEEDSYQNDMVQISTRLSFGLKHRVRSESDPSPAGRCAPGPVAVAGAREAPAQGPGEDAGRWD